MDRVGLLWRGDRRSSALPPKVESRLGPLFAEFVQRGVSVEPVVYADEALEAVRAQVLVLDGVLVWVNPIQDGANRSRLDALLQEVSAAGVWVSAHPDLLRSMGSKEVLYTTRGLGWGTDTDLYGSFEDLVERFPARLAFGRARVLKQARGNGGEGTWKVELIDPETVRVRHAVDRAGECEQLPLSRFLDRCQHYFAWSGSLVDMPFQDRLVEGMLRCYFVQDHVVGFCHQWPRGLLSAAEFEQAPQKQPVMEPASTPAYQSLKARAETEWVPAMNDMLELDRESLPAIWDADFLYGPRTAAGEDTYVLCEINVSAVWPYPPQATSALAAATIAGIHANRKRR